MIIKIRFPIFHSPTNAVWFLVNVTDQEFEKVLKKKELNPGVIPEESLAVTVTSGFNVVIRFKCDPRVNFGIVAHEIFHAVSQMADHAGIKLDESSEEFFAYSQQFLIEEFIKKLKQSDDRLSRPPKGRRARR